MMKICSFLPSATEIVCCLGLEEALVGRSHECDYPLSVRSKPAVVGALVDSAGNPREIDEAVRKELNEKGSLYRVEEAALRRLKPDLILTQELCQVCAPSGKEVSVALRSFNPPPRVLYLTPRSLEGVFQNILEVGAVVGRLKEAEKIVEGLQRRVEDVRTKARSLPKPRVFVLEWTDPPFAAGHWIHEMAELAGGRDNLGSAGDSRRISWEDILSYDPEILIVAPCGYHLDRVVREAGILSCLPGWQNLAAVRGKKVFAVDADAYLIRPGPRLVEGLELLAHLFHPERFPRPPLDGMCEVCS